MHKVLALLVALTVAVCGCGGDDGDDAAPSESSTSVTVTTESDAPTTAWVAPTTVPPSTQPTTTTTRPPRPPAPPSDGSPFTPQQGPVPDPVPEPIPETVPETVPPIDPEPSLAAAATDAAAGFDGSAVAGRSCAPTGPEVYECDVTTTAGGTLRVRVTVAADGGYIWQRL